MTIQTAKPSAQTVEKSKFRCGKGDVDTKRNDIILSDNLQTS